MNYFLDCLKNYAKFDGRARRTEYWMFFLFTTVIAFLLGFISGLIEIPALSIISILYCLAVFVPGLAVSVRRLHDIGKSWPWIFITLIPFVGGIWFLILMCLDGQPGANEFGENPKGV